MFQAFVHWRCYPAGRWRARPQGVGRTSEAARCTQNGWVCPLGLPGRWALVFPGDRATRGASEGCEVSLNFRRFRRMLGREHRTTVDGRARIVRAGYSPIIDYRAIINFVDAIFGRSGAT